MMNAPCVGATGFEPSRNRYFPRLPGTCRSPQFRGFPQRVNNPPPTLSCFFVTTARFSDYGSPRIHRNSNHQKAVKREVSNNDGTDTNGEPEVAIPP